MNPNEWNQTPRTFWAWIKCYNPTLVWFEVLWFNPTTAAWPSGVSFLFYFFFLHFDFQTWTWCELVSVCSDTSNYGYIDAVLLNTILQIRGILRCTTKDFYSSDVQCEHSSQASLFNTYSHINCFARLKTAVARSPSRGSVLIRTTKCFCFIFNMLRLKTFSLMI